jgi:hypothetical protein
LAIALNYYLLFVFIDLFHIYSDACFLGLFFCALEIGIEEGLVGGDFEGHQVYSYGGVDAVVGLSLVVV